MHTKPVQGTRPTQLLKLVYGMPLVPGRAVAHTPPDLCDHPVAAAVEYGLGTSPPAGSPAAIERFDR